jgi:EAL domain-containing protein (putative c-di-GMP-specific phosphodiesterase class I)
MDNQEPRDAVKLAAVARQKAMPRVCIADAKQSIRTFIAEALEELGFATFDCARIADLDAALERSRPGLVVIGSSAGGIEACQMMELLAARQFDGKVLVLGPRISPMVSAIRGLGKKLGLAILPLLPTPFGNGDVRDCVAMLLPDAILTAPPRDSSRRLRTTRHELWYLPKIDTCNLALSGAEAISSAPANFVIAQAVDDWRYFAARHGHVEISVNLPLSFLRDRASVDYLCRQMPDDPAFEGLIIGVSAAEVVRDLELMKGVTRRLRDHSIAISINNLGTEWPSLLGLRDFPFVELKVDRQFAAGAADSGPQQATCRRIVDLADAMGARTVANGVETRADFLAMREIGFHRTQGPLFGRPLTAEQFARTVLGHRAMAPK